MANATARGAELMAGLKAVQAKFPAIIKDVRGIGLMIGVEFATHELAAAPECGLLPARSAGPRSWDDRWSAFRRPSC